jgi:hypothetical protein
MKKNEILTIVLFILIFISLFGSFFSFFDTKQYSMNQIASSPGEINLFIPPVCGDGPCDAPFENCTSCPIDCGECSDDDGDDDGDNGGGGGGSSSNINFIFSPDLLQERLFPGESINRIVTVTNTGDKNIRVLLDVLDLGDFVFLNKDSLELRVDKSDTFESLLSVSELATPGVYLGSIVGSASGIEKTLPIVLTVDEVGAPIYVDIVLSEGFGEVFAGETIQGEIIILSNVGGVQVDITNSIRNWKEEEILSRSGQLDLRSGENLFTDDFDIPSDAPPGYYAFYVNVTHEGKSYTDAIAFKVKTRRGVEGLFLTDSIFYFWLVLLIASIIFIVFFLRRIVAKQKSASLLVGKKKREAEKKRNAYSNLANDAIAKIKAIRSNGKYTRASIRKHSVIIRRFFSKYYKVKASLTFEELVVILGKKDIKDRKRVVSFLNKMAHVPYDSTLISKNKFNLLIDDSINLLSSYRGETYNGKE